MSQFLHLLLKSYFKYCGISVSYASSKLEYQVKKMEKMNPWTIENMTLETVMFFHKPILW